MPPYPKPTKITSLRIYPIKSCRGITLSKSTLTRKGLKHDRVCMFIDAKNVFITIREKPQMTLIQTAIETDEDDDESKEWLRITFPEVVSVGGKGQEGEEPKVDYERATSVRIPLEPSQDWLESNTELVDAEIWKYETDAYAVTDSAIASVVKGYFSAWESNSDVRLVIKGPTDRECRGNGAKEYLGRSESVNFPDVLPLQVASEASLKELNGRLTQGGAEAITIERFRPNIIVDSENLEAWEEDEWRVLRVNPPKGMVGSLAAMTGVGSQSVDVDVVARCARCHVPNVDPDTAVPNKKEPWGTLYGYRRVDEGVKYKPCFGMLCCPRGEGVIEVGMEVEIREVMEAAGGKGEHRYVKGF